MNEVLAERIAKRQAELAKLSANDRMRNYNEWKAGGGDEMKAMSLEDRLKFSGEDVQKWARDHPGVDPIEFFSRPENRGTSEYQKKKEEKFWKDFSDGIQIGLDHTVGILETPINEISKAFGAGEFRPLTDIGKEFGKTATDVIRAGTKGDFGKMIEAVGKEAISGAANAIVPGSGKIIDTAITTG
jgi:hypothetical protein